MSFFSVRRHATFLSTAVLTSSFFLVTISRSIDATGLQLARPCHSERILNVKPEELAEFEAEVKRDSFAQEPSTFIMLFY